MSRSVLVVTPTYGNLLRPETTAAGSRALAWDGAVKWEVLRHNPFPAPDMRNVLAQYQRAREIALSLQVDALLTIEHDMVPPPEALMKLWSAQKPVVYGVYLLRHGVKVLNTYEYAGARNLGESLSLHPDRLEAARKGGELVRVSGVGFGCTLIRREVLERFEFHGGPSADDYTPDVPFATDLVRAGVEQWAHFGVLCGHVDEGRVLMPFDETTVRVIALATMTVRAGDASVPIVAGREYALPAGDALELARAGYVRVEDRARESASIEPRVEKAVMPRAQAKRAKGH